MFAVGYNIKTISNINFLDRQAFASRAFGLQRTLKKKNDQTMTHSFDGNGFNSWCLFIKVITENYVCSL